MVQSAKPPNYEGLCIVVVVSIGGGSSTLLAWLGLEVSTLQGGVHSVMSCALLRGAWMAIAIARP